jgi:MarR family transcriptional regulator, transcriptional regulator for hemolysin
MQSADDSLGILVSRSARSLDRALDQALTATGGSLATWLVLQALGTAEHATQAEVARTVGVRQPTLTHHLDSLERSGFVTRHRDAGDRRAQRVLLTDEGRRLFVRLRRVAAAFDGQLRAGLSYDEVAVLERLLGQLVDNAQPDDGTA